MDFISLFSSFDLATSFLGLNGRILRRQQTGGWHYLGRNISWDMVRLTPVETPFALHVSDCLDDLKPGDHIEIQWRPTRERPYDWWYAVIGHLDSCNESENHCWCHLSETFVVEFVQYPHGSSMRRIMLSRTNYGEQTDRSGGFYGGTKILHSEDEIGRWKKNYPPENEPMVYGAPPVPAQVQLM